MSQQSSTISRPQLPPYCYSTSLAPRVALPRFACSPAYPDAACVTEIGRTIKSKFRFHRRRPFLSLGRVRHHRTRRLPLERDQTKCGSQTPFPLQANQTVSAVEIRMKGRPSALKATLRAPQCLSFHLDPEMNGQNLDCSSPS